MSPVKARTLDFTNVKESSGINPKHIEAGEYLARITDVTEIDKDGTPMWLFLIQLDEMRSAVYPYYCKLQENQLWKVRNLFIAAGQGNAVAGKKATKVDPNKVIGKSVGVVLEDDEYEGKMKSVIEALMPASDLEDGGAPEGAIDEEDDDDDDEVEEAPVAKKKVMKVAEPVEDEDADEDEPVVVPKKRKRAPEPEPEEEDDEEEPEEKPVSKRTAARRAAKAAAAAEEDEDEDEDDEPAPAPKAKRKAKPIVVEDDDEDELDLDDLEDD